MRIDDLAVGMTYMGATQYTEGAAAKYYNLFTTYNCKKLVSKRLGRAFPSIFQDGEETRNRNVHRVRGRLG